ncbi:MAG: GlsB/YeaQ/YmgE family stress response membrane protein [Armatimonadota bacterium]
MMSILGWIVIGGLAGWAASALMGTRQGCIMDVIVGIIGAFLGGLVFNLLGGAGVTGFNLWSFFVALIGAVILIAILRAIRGPAEPVD